MMGSFVRCGIAVWLVALTLVPAEGSSQSSPRLEIERGDGSSTSVSMRLDRGYAVVPLSVLEDLGWSVAEDDGGVTLGAADEIEVSMRIASPFFRWDGVVLQMTDAPYRAGAQTLIPVQFLSDFLPRRLPGLYEFDGPRSVLRAGDLTLLGAGDLEAMQTAALGSVATAQAGATALAADRGPADSTADDDRMAEDEPAGFDGGAPATAAGAAVGVAVSSGNSAEAVRNAGPSAYDGVRVVIIDPGHGGADPGALGPDGTREKDVALGIGLRLADELRGQPDLEVHLLRSDDTFVDVWERGQIATDLKGERPGIFVSIHANSFPARREARGFETYFLSDARTEHERRVSAIENAPLTMNPQFADAEQLEDLDFILRDLKNYEHAHWSANLAGLVQGELDDFHPGPNRGVKQGVLAVLTNALMPSVLVEVGYLSNPSEGQILAQDDFQANSAEAIGEAVLAFFDRYPPGSGTGGASERR